MNKKKNLLMICPPPSGMLAFFFEGREEYKGMPAFKEVFLSILEDERLDTLHLILLVTNEQKDRVNVPKRFQEKIKIYPIVFEMAHKVTSLMRVLKGVRLGTKLVKQHNIEKIAGFRSHGSAMAAMIGRRTKKHNSRRLYGSFLINEIDIPKWKLFLRHPLEYLSFAMPGGTLFITNDGTKGDVVFRKIGSSNLDFRFLLNGIDKKIDQNIVKPKIDLPDNYLVYVARIVGWKRQHLLVEALGVLAAKNVKVPKCYIIGTVNNDAYYEDLLARVKKNKLEDSVKIICGLPMEECHYLIKHSVLTFSLYHTSNLGNVFLEAVSLGAPMMAINDTGSLNQFPKNIFFELENGSPEHIAENIEKALANSDLLEKVASAAKEYSHNNFKSWQERASVEVDLLLT